MQVIDGLTIAVSIAGQREVSMRYLGVATVVSKDPRRPPEVIEEAVTAVNGELVAGKTVYLDKDVSEQDGLGHLLRYVYLADGTFVNRELVARGFALAASTPPDTKRLDSLRAAEQEARQASRGLWGPVETFGPMEILPLLTLAPGP